MELDEIRERLALIRYKPQGMGQPPKLYLEFAIACGFNYIGISACTSRASFTQTKRDCGSAPGMRWWNIERGVWEDRGWKDVHKARKFAATEAP